MQKKKLEETLSTMSQESIERFDPAKEWPLISHGLPYPEAIARHLTQTLHCKRPFLIVSKSLSRDPEIVERLKNALDKEKGEKGDSIQLVGIQPGMQSHTYYSEVLDIARRVSEAGADSLVTIGGGSLVDGSKAISLVGLLKLSLDDNYIRVQPCQAYYLLHEPSLLHMKMARRPLPRLTSMTCTIKQALANDAITNHEALDTLLRASNTLRRHPQHHPTPENTITVHPPHLPIISVPTTLSAGDFNPGGGATNDQTHYKQSFYPPPKFNGERRDSSSSSSSVHVIVLDPLLTTSTPERVWLGTGMRAVDHCVETICSSNPYDDEEGTPSSVRGLKRLVSGLLRTRRAPGDVEARLECLLGAGDSMRASIIHGVHVGESFFAYIMYPSLFTLSIPKPSITKAGIGSVLIDV